MATKSDWIYSIRDNAGNLTQAFNVNSKAMYNTFSSKAVLSFDYGISRLFSFLDDQFKSVTSVNIFKDYSTWLSSLIYYPFDINYWMELDQTIPRESNGLSIGGDKIGETQGEDRIIWCEPSSARSTMFNLGELYIKKHFGNFADYNGYTKIQVFLPYYGFVDVNPNDVVGKYLQIRLQVDLNTGGAQYYIGVNDYSVTNLDAPLQLRVYDDAETRILSTHSFQLGVHIPIGLTNTSEIVRNVALGATKSALTLAGYAIGGVAGAGISTITTSKAPKVVTKTKRSPKGRQVIANRWTTEYGDTTKTYDHTNNYKQQAINEVFSSSAQALNNFNFAVQTDRANNSLVNSFASLSVKVLIYRPKLIDVDDDYLKLYGQPLGETRELSTLSGYTEISQIFFEGEEFEQATYYEQSLLDQAFSEGVIL